MKRPEQERDSCLFERWHHGVVGASPWGDIVEIFSLLGVTLSSWKALRVNAGLDNTQRKLGCTLIINGQANTHATQTHIPNTAGYTSVCATGAAPSLKDVAGLCTFLCVILQLMATLTLQGAGTEHTDPPVAPPRHPSSTSSGVTNALQPAAKYRT